MVLGSDVPLEQDIFKQKVEFSKDWKEWASNNRDQVVASISSTAGVDATIFTVPAGFNLFVTSAFLTAANTGASRSGASLFYSPIAFSPIFLIRLFNGAGNDGHINMVFPMPIKIPSGMVVTLSLGAGVDGSAGVYGWLEPNFTTN